MEYSWPYALKQACVMYFFLKGRPISIPSLSSDGGYQNRRELVKCVDLTLLTLRIAYVLSHVQAEHVPSVDFPTPT
jgi:hypothetical protein